MRFTSQASIFSHFRTLAIGALFLFFLTFNIGLSMAQQEGYSKVTLKSGLVLTGKIISMDVASTMELEVSGGIKVELDMKDVAEIKPAEMTDSESYLPRVRREKLRYDFKPKGYYLGADIGLPFGVDTYGDPTLNVSFMLKGGYTFNRLFALGLVTGTDFYWWPNTVISPLAIEIKGRLRYDGFTPYYSIQSGYGFLTSAEYWIEETKGGWFFAPGFGLIAKNREHSGWNLHFGFRTQSAEGLSESFGFPGPIFIKEKIVYNRFDVRFGFFFE